MNPQPIYTFAKWTVKQGRKEHVLSLLATVAAKSKEEPGNLFYKVYQSNADDHVLILSEGYTDEAAVNIHRNSDHFQQLVVGRIIPELESREVLLATEIQSL